MIDPENFLDDNQRALRWARGVGTIAAELKAIGCSQFDVMSHRLSPWMFVEG
jgi:hypothetical protein